MQIETKKKNSKELTLVSVVILTRNRAVSLRRALGALKAQKYPQYEIIVVDNDSKDDTAQVAQEFSAKYIFSPSTNGISLSRRLGVDAAAGAIIAFCDDDCAPAPDWLQHLVRRLDNEQDLGLLGGQVINIGFDDAHQYKGRQKWTERNGKLTFAVDPKEADFFGNANLAFRKAAYQAVGGYDSFFRANMEEIDLAMKFRRHGFRVDYEPAAIVNHYFTGVNHKRGRIFYDNHLMRLYFYLKHCRPRRLNEWWRFSRREMWLVGDDLYKWSRVFAAAILKVRLRRLPAVAIELFNIISARLVIPWLLWRIPKQEPALNGYHRQ
jgi:GT2 family glycosyltransferase